MLRVQKSRLTILIAVVAALVLAVPAQAATTTEETGPLVPRTPQTYVYDFATRDITNKETGAKVVNGIDLGKCPVLFPGDSVESIPEPTKDNGDSRKGFGFIDDDDYPQANRYDSRGPIEVTGTEEWGGATYITSFTNTGDKPVLVWANTSCTLSSERVSDDVFHNYVASELNFVIYPRTQPVEYECVNESGALSDEELATAAYYTTEKNPTVFYAEDALANRWEHNDYAHGVTVHRPYIEGYTFTGSAHDWKCWTQIFEVYGADDGWEGDATEIYPQWRGSSHDTQDLNGKPEDHLLMQFKYAAGRTLTLDAQGGTIDGYPVRIYEADAADFDAKAADQALAAKTAWVPTREGYVFGGWCTDKACKTPMKGFEAELAQYASDGTTAADRACHLYAKWDKKDAPAPKPAPKPTWSGASKLPLSAQADYAVTADAEVCLKGANGKWVKSDKVLNIASVSPTTKRLTAQGTGTTTLYLVDKDGKAVANKQVTVFGIGTGTYVLESGLNGKYCLDIKMASKDDGAPMVIWTKNGQKNQRFQFKMQNDGSYQIVCTHSGKCVDVKCGGMTSGQPIIQWKWKGGKNQRWNIKVDAKNRLTFINENSNACLDVQYGKIGAGNPTVQWPFKNGDNQKWVLVK